MKRILFAVGCLAFLQPPTAQAQWPERSITLVVAFPAGGADDALARLLAPKMAEALGQSVAVENIGGRGGMVGGAAVAKSAPDGYRILLGSSATHALSQALYSTPLYDAAADFEPVRLLVQQPMVLVVRKDLEANGLQEFVSRIKTGSLRYGSAGTGSATHIACARLNAEVGGQATHVPYDGGGPAMRDLVAGKIDFFCPVITIAIPPVHRQAVKAIATLGPLRSPALPEAPSAVEQGLGDFTATTWFAIFAPKGTPPVVIQTINRAADAALSDSQVRGQLRAIGADSAGPESSAPGYLKGFVEKEIERYKAAVKKSGIPVQ
jgi:tripartite-type tricarboxylate transporter receptor subunit TctC